MPHRIRLEPKPPDLRFVPVESLFPHEQPDDQRLDSLVERFREQQVLKNPPIVTPLANGAAEPHRYMVLDGANRATAARAAGFPHMVVQVTRYERPDIELTTWNHALAERPRAEFEVALGKITGLELESTGLMHARAQLARREGLAYIGYEDGSAATLQGGRDLGERNELLNAVVGLYQKTRFYREPGDSFDEAKARHAAVTALVVFPHFEPAEILELAGSGARLPAGISRHLVQWRALRVNVPLDKLNDAKLSLDAKNEWLKSWLREKAAQRQIRYYEEPTVLFDE